MKLGLHAHSLVLAGGLREYQPVGRGALQAGTLLEKAVQWKFNAVQLARRNIADLSDMVTLVNLRHQADAQGLLLHLSTNRLQGEHLADMVRAAYTLGAPQVTVGLSHLKGSVKQRQQALETLLVELEVAIKTAERYKITLAIENGRHTAAADLAALIQAAQSPWVGACFDMGNALTVPENPVDSAGILAPHCRSIHLKDLKVYRSVTGVVLVNCPIGDGAVDVVEVLRVLNPRQSGVPIFLQTVAERYTVPVLEETFLQEYPRITARSLAGLLRHGTLVYTEDELIFPHEGDATEREILKWEEERVKRSLKQAQKLLGKESLTLSLG